MGDNVVPCIHCDNLWNHLMDQIYADSPEAEYRTDEISPEPQDQDLSQELTISDEFRQSIVQGELRRQKRDREERIRNKNCQIVDITNSLLPTASNLPSSKSLRTAMQRSLYSQSRLPELSDMYERAKRSTLQYNNYSFWPTIPLNLKYRRRK